MLVVFGVALAASLQAAGAAVPPPDTLVRIDAFVVDARGRTVDDLRASDFDLREDGAPQTIDSLRFVRAGARTPNDEAPHPIESDADERREASRAGARLFAIFLDEYHVSAGAAADRVRDALTRFIDASLGPRDLLVVMKPLDSLFAIRLAYDRAAARQTIAAFEGRKGLYAARNAYEQNYMASTPGAVELMRWQVTVSAVNALAVHLGWVAPDARKSLIIVSEGLGRPTRRRGLSLPTIESVTRSANRSNVSVYTIDSREDVNDADVNDAGEGDALRAVAAQTDGLSIVSADALDAGLRRIEKDSGAYYLITYRSAKKIDSQFHEVQLRAKRPGAHVRTRPGYWALSPDDLLRAEVLAAASRPKPTAPLEPAPHVSRLIKPWFGLARGDAGKTRVTFVWEPISRVPGDRSRLVPSRLTFTALGTDGHPVFEGAVLPAGPAVLEADGPVPTRAVFEVPPGRIRIRMSIEDAGLQVIDSDVREIVVRDLHAPVVLGTPEILRARNAREFRTLNANPQAVPVASREFSRMERLMIRVPAYAPDGSPAVSARLMSRTGQAMRTLTVSPPAAAGGENEIDLPLAGLASGDYQIEVTATSPAGQATDLVSFRVTS
jgi:VWFA-related protein